jgi:hypothetical protein
MIEIQNHWPTPPNHQRETIQLLRRYLHWNEFDWLTGRSKVNKTEQNHWRNKQWLVFVVPSKHHTHTHTHTDIHILWCVCVCSFCFPFFSAPVFVSFGVTFLIKNNKNNMEQPPFISYSLSRKSQSVTYTHQSYIGEFSKLNIVIENGSFIFVIPDLYFSGVYILKNLRWKKHCGSLVSGRMKFVVSCRLNEICRN